MISRAREEDKSRVGDLMSDSKPDDMEIPLSPEKELIVDSVRAIATYILGSIDWFLFSDFAKELSKDEPSVSLAAATQGKAGSLIPNPVQVRRVKQDVVGHLIRFLSKSKAPENLTLDAFFSGGKIAVGVRTYLALSALALDEPERLAGAFGILLPARRRAKEARAIKSVAFFGLMLRQAEERFGSDACKELIADFEASWTRDPRFSKEIMESPALLLPLFGLSGKSEGLQKIYADILYSLSPALQSQTWSRVQGTSAFRLSLLNEALTLTLLGTDGASFRDLKHADKQPFAKCALYAYEIEDILDAELSIAGSKEFIQTVGKLILLADRLDLIYVSLPSLAWMDERVTTVPRWEERSPAEGREPVVIPVQREGGILRVLMKTLFMAAKCDATTEMVTDKFLRYLVFREKPDKHAIKDLLGFKRRAKQKQNPKTKQPRATYGLLDAVLRKEPDSAKQFSATTEFYLKKVIWNDVSVLDSRRVQKSAPEFVREKGFFERAHTVIMYLVCELVHLMHFELFGVPSYKQLPKAPEELASISDQYRSGKKPLSKKFRALQKLLCDIFQYDKKHELTSTVLNDFDKVFDAIKLGLRSALPAGIIPKLGEVCSVLDLDSICGKPSLDRQGEVSDEEIKAQGERLDRFRKDWRGFFQQLAVLVETEKLGEYLLSAEVLTGVQPYAVLFTGGQMRRLDQSVKDSVGKGQTSTVRDETSEVTMFKCELVSRVKEKLANISISKAKIGSHLCLQRRYRTR